MFILIMIVGLVFLIAGGVGLFYTNINLASGTHLWIYGNITFGTFTAVGVLTLFFMALFNREFEYYPFCFEVSNVNDWFLLTFRSRFDHSEE